MRKSKGLGSRLWENGNTQVNLRSIWGVKIKYHKSKYLGGGGGGGGVIHGHKQVGYPTGQSYMSKTTKHMWHVKHMLKMKCKEIPQKRAVYM